MTSDQKAKLTAKGVCLVLAVGFWWAVKTRLEPDFWQKAIADVKSTTEKIEEKSK